MLKTTEVKHIRQQTIELRSALRLDASPTGRRNLIGCAPGSFPIRFTLQVRFLHFQSQIFLQLEIQL